MIRVSITGLKEFERKLKAAPAKILKEVDAEVKDAANEFSLLAKQSASSQFGDKGFLVTQIQAEAVAPLRSKVVSGAHYSPYLEFGTIQHVSVPSDLQDYAIQFKGMGIRTTGGIIPRPFFFKHMPKIQKQLVDRVKNVLGGL